MTLSTSIHAVAHATEDIPKLILKMNELFSIPKERFLISRARGHWDNEISLIRADCDHQESSALLETIISKLKTGEKIIFCAQYLILLMKGTIFTSG